MTRLTRVAKPDRLWLGRSRWAHLGSNQGPLACEASALPLSYAPGRVVRLAHAGRRDSGSARAEDELAVAELVPAVAVLEGRVGRLHDQALPADGAEQVEV